jgi:hypothetical protein
MTRTQDNEGSSRSTKDSKLHARYAGSKKYSSRESAGNSKHSRGTIVRKKNTYEHGQKDFSHDAQSVMCNSFEIMMRFDDDMLMISYRFL